MTLEARCHCGDTRIALPAVPTQAARCNCTFCRRTGAVWAYYDAGELKIMQDDSRQSYGTDPKVGQHHFCGRCGMHTWGKSVNWTDTSSAPDADAAPPEFTKNQVNLNLVDNLDWSQIEIEEMDGLNQW